MTSAASQKTGTYQARSRTRHLVKVSVRYDLNHLMSVVGSACDRGYGKQDMRPKEAELVKVLALLHEAVSAARWECTPHSTNAVHARSGCPCPNTSDLAVVDSTAGGETVTEQCCGTASSAKGRRSCSAEMQPGVFA